MRTKTLSTCAAILILSGLPMGVALAQQPADPGNPTRPGTQERQPQGRTQQGIHRTKHFTKYDDLRGSRVHNQAGEAIASVRDLIVDRGTGEIKHVVVRSGSVMGMGGNQVAIPFSRFSWDSNEQRLTLNQTADQIQNIREFDRNSWSNVFQEDAAGNHKTAYQQLQQDPERPEQMDNYHQNLRSSETVELTGTVRRIRTDNNAPGSPMVLTIETREHGMVDVMLAPAWYSLGFAGTPMRGEQVTIRASEFNRTGQGITPNPRQPDGANPRPNQPGDNPDRNNPDRNNPDRNNPERNNPDRNAPGTDARQGDTRINQSGKTFIARSIRGTRGEVNLRGDDWQPLWNTETRQPGTTQQRTRGSQYVPFRYVLIGDVIGKDIQGRAEDCGEVQTAIIDIRNGHVAFLGVDADENFLGIGGGTYLVPWSIVRVQANGVVVDSSCSQIKSAMTLPDELDDLGDESNWQRLFRNFDIDEPGHRDDDMRRPMDPTRDRNLPDRERDSRPTPRR